MTKIVDIAVLYSSMYHNNYDVKAFLAIEII